MPVRTCYPAFSIPGAPALALAGRLDLPQRGTPGPAVLICHGSDGVDARGAFHRAALNAAGLATFEIDMWAARGTRRGASARPASPLETLADAFAALDLLRSQPEIDPERIGIMGFSWGGAVTLLAARRREAGGPTFAAHAAFYPVCWAYSQVPEMRLEPLSAVPILIQTGDADAYDRPGAGEQLAEHLRVAAAEVRAIEYPGAGHGFDRDMPAQTISDPFAHEGRGGPVLMAYDEAAALAARRAAVRFFLRTL